MAEYAEVVLPLAVDKTFTYLVPSELRESAVVGVRVIVPFGRKYATGLIIGCPASPAVSQLKAIRDVVDPAPVIRDELL